MNKSIAKINHEVAVAKKQALRDPYQYERADTVVGVGEEANSLTDTVLTQNKLQNAGRKAFPTAVREQIDYIFDKFPIQLKTLGLYYDGGFTTEEIAEMSETSHQNVTVTLRRAKARLKKYLAPEAYDSIRWAIGDPKKVEATQPRFVNPFYNDFVEQQPVREGRLACDGTTIMWFNGPYTDGVTVPTPVNTDRPWNHPPEKQLPKGSFYYEVQSIETGISGCAH